MSQQQTCNSIHLGPVESLNFPADLSVIGSHGEGKPWFIGLVRNCSVVFDVFLHSRSSYSSLACANVLYLFLRSCLRKATVGTVKSILVSQKFGMTSTFYHRHHFPLPKVNVKKTTICVHKPTKTGCRKGTPGKLLFGKNMQRELLLRVGQLVLSDTGENLHGQMEDETWADKIELLLCRKPTRLQPQLVDTQTS